ncbi:membrane protein [Nocardiopsis ansamitocini]|uniref:Membrane protein n=1 Tax=Nocardiopsis ansamitocini TaxID=1670832 RepID=A0A9W6P5R6_9ACTN|nr:ElyC/SanA/YdcF family protein [Nocardiopsis ansamitocini]GLU47700.1 membrane protein [Nocardiopsis ansamitocini]
MLAAAVLLGLAPITWLHASTSGDRFAAGQTPHRPVALVLGAGVRPDGSPTRLLERRLDLAAQLYHQARVEAVLVSGDNSRETYNETDAMAAYLVGAGVPEEKIAGDYAGFSTWESCVRAREVFGVEAVTVVTQSFHLPRAVALCKRAGLDAIGVGDPGQGTDRVTATIYGHFREVPAAFKAVADALLRPDPTFLGPYEPGVDDALAVER